MANGIAAIQNQISTTTTATTTTPATGTTTTTVAQRQNQVSCILYHVVYHPSLWWNIQGFKSKLATGTFHSLLWRASYSEYLWLNFLHGNIRLYHLFCITKWLLKTILTILNTYETVPMSRVLWQIWVWYLCNYCLYHKMVTHKLFDNPEHLLNISLAKSIMTDLSVIFMQLLLCITKWSLKNFFDNPKPLLNSLHAESVVTDLSLIFMQLL